MLGIISGRYRFSFNRIALLTRLIAATASHERNNIHHKDREYNEASRDCSDRPSIAYPHFTGTLFQFYLRGPVRCRHEIHLNLRLVCLDLCFYLPQFSSQLLDDACFHKNELLLCALL